MTVANSAVSKPRHVEVAETILRQLGPMAQMELGVKGRYAIEEQAGGVELHLSGLPQTRGKRVKIVLTSADEYDIEVYRVRAGKVTKLGSAEGIHFPELADTVCDLVWPRA